MVYVIEGNSADELFVKASRELLKNGTYVNPRAQKTLELQNVWLTLNDASKSIVELPERGINKKYLHGELEWYKSGSLNVKDIAKYSKFWNKIANPDGSVNSNYGFFAFYQKNNGLNQYDWVVNSLKKDPDSRQAVINYNQPKHKYLNNKDFVCTLSQQFRRSNSGTLDSIVNMRSNDMIFGLTYDLPWFTYLQNRVSDDCGIGLGKYHHIAQSFHVYEKHFEMLESIAGARYE